MLRLVKKFLAKRNANCSAVIVAAGSSQRMNGTDKILYKLGEEPLIVHTIRAFQAHKSVAEIVVVTRQDLIDTLIELCQKSGFDKVKAVVPGGSDRCSSVMNGLDAVSSDIPYVAIHDGARPFVSGEIITETLEKAGEFHAAAPAIPVKDTVKVAMSHIVKETPNRASLFAVQTPQIFDFDLLRGALVKATSENYSITDDCSAVEAIGMSVYLTNGSDENIKVTTPTDLLLAQAIWERRKQL